jgi:S1-C subfamily serine protease
LRAYAVDVDAHDDIAVLRVPGLSEPSLKLAADPSAGTAAGILGYPLDGSYDAEPGRIGQTQTVETEDAYGNGPVLRSITSMRGRVRPGNSGGPMVDSAGEVVATVFAAITGGPGNGGFAVPNALVRDQLRAAASHGDAPVGTGPCAS